jgi:hypothetical protein
VAWQARSAMSEYGKIWMQIAEIRNELKRLVPAMNTERVELAMADGAKIKHLLLRWEELEALAKRVPE